jgi:hypothetical protein
LLGRPISFNNRVEHDNKLQGTIIMVQTQRATLEDDRRIKEEKNAHAFHHTFPQI